MSILLNRNEPKIVSWKGRTLNQITSSIKRNENTISVTRDTIFRAMPLKIYRREIATNVTNKYQNACHKSRASISIDELNRPGGFILPNSNIDSDKSGQFNVLESNDTGNLNENYGCSNKGLKDSYNCAEKNARRRCRSSGFIKKTYNEAQSDVSYFTNTNQYLVSRSKSFSQNQYKHIRPTDVSVLTNPLQSNKTYSPNGISHCPKAYISEGENVFYYYWIDASGTDFASTTKRNTITIPQGYYDIHELNSEFETEMSKNLHYFVHKTTNVKTYLMKIIYNSTTNCIEIQSFSSKSVSFLTHNKPFSSTWGTPDIDMVPVYFIPNTGFQNIIGFKTGFYPNVSSNVDANKTINGSAYGALSNMSHKVYPSYSITYYKPSNGRFATQGGVSSSDMTQRVKYETITRNGLIYSSAFGSQVGNAMSYGVSEKVYTIKDKIGYTDKLTPVIDKYTGAMKRLMNGRLVGKCSSAPNG